MSRRFRDKYVDLKINGRLFPTWLLKNFKKYKLPEIIRGDTDPCARKDTATHELKAYQEFVAKYLDYNSPYSDILIYHGLGAGKTVSTINVYNMLYNYTPGWNVFILLKASLKDHPWMSSLEEWLAKDEKKFRMENIRFISYDSPFADKAFMEAVKQADSSKKSLYIIEEAHNFIRNVYTNISTKKGKRAQTIYDYIIQDKRENEGVRVVLLSGTPAINSPYELALIFNLLRPSIFPKSEAQFNQLYVSSTGYETINDVRKNNFQRRIMGLVSYYVGSTPDLFATKKIDYVDVDMSEYQEDIYSYYEDIEDKMEKKRRGKSGPTTYKSYTRQACNFVFPPMAQGMTGESRPRPHAFKLSSKEADKLERSNMKDIEKGSDKYFSVQNYMKAIDGFVDTFDNYLADKMSNDKKNGYTIVEDIKKFHQTYNGDFSKFVKKESKKSQLFEALHTCSAKMLNIVFNILKSPGPALVYSNYVLMEGLQIFKIYLKYFGFSGFKNTTTGVDDFRYIEYHGGIKMEERKLALESFNHPDNKYGRLVKLILVSPAGSEGLSLLNARQVHIMEPYWHETRIEQMIGRAVRMCSHKSLPMAERHVDVFRYKSIRHKKAKWTADQQIEDIARSKQSLIQSFLNVVKEVAIDCVLFKNHNMLDQEYKCFKFEEPSLFDDQIGPAYKDDIYDDLKIDNGSNSVNATNMRIKVIKIRAVKQLTKGGDNEEIKYSKESQYWYNPDTGVVYDLDLLYALGKVAIDDDGLPAKLDKDVYIIDKMIPIPHIEDE